jgi:hypothetical protein
MNKSTDEGMSHWVWPMPIGKMVGPAWPEGGHGLGFPGAHVPSLAKGPGPAHAGGGGGGG